MARRSRTVPAAQKRAMARGRKLAGDVRAYLEVLEAGRGARRRNPDTLRRQLADIEARWESADPLARVHLAQRRIDLRRALDGLQGERHWAEVEARFVRSAKAYGAAKGISYAAWREVGVPAALLRKAGITRRT